MNIAFVQQNMKYITIVEWACHTGCHGTDIGNWEHVKDQQFLVQYISRNEILNHEYSTRQDRGTQKIKMQPNAKAYLI